MHGLRHIFFYILLASIIASCTHTGIKENYRKGKAESNSRMHLIDPQYRDFLEEHKYIHNLLDSFEYCSRQNNTASEARARIKIADYLRSTGNYTEGINFLQSFLKQPMQLDDQTKAYAFFTLSAIYYELYFHKNKDLQFLDSAKHYAHESLAISTKKDAALISNLLNITGGIYLQKHIIDKAISRLDSALKIRKSAKLPSDPALLNNLAFAYNQKGNYKAALKYAQECHKLSREKDDEVFTAISLETMANIYGNMGDSIQVHRMKSELDKIKYSKTAILKNLIAKELILNYQHNKDSEKISDLNEDQFFLIRLSRLLTITAIILILGFVLILYFLRQNKKLLKSEKELQKSRIESQALKLQNTQLELKAKEAESKALKTQLEKNEAHLAAKLTALSQSNEFLMNIRKDLIHLSQSKDTESALVELTHIEEKIAQQLNGNIWEEFELLYSSGNSSFIKKLSERFPELTTNDKRLCYLILMNLSTKEISDILSKSSRSVEVARHRLRNKLGLDRGNNLHAFLLDFSKNL